MLANQWLCVFATDATFTFSLKGYVTLPAAVATVLLRTTPSSSPQNGKSLSGWRPCVLDLLVICNMSPVARRGPTIL